MSNCSVPASAPQPSTTILIVDDSQQIRAQYSAYLTSEPTIHCRILEAKSVQEGLRLWRSEHPDIVLVDYLLPDGNGLGLLEVMGNGNPNAKLSAIMLTAEGDEQVAVQAMKFGAMDYLAKRDVTEFSLCQSIRSLLERKQAEAVLQFQGQILEEIHDAVISTDTAGRINSWNRGAERLYGYSAKEILGQDIRLLYENSIEIDVNASDGRLTPDRQDIELKALTKSGEEIDISLRFSAVRNEQGQVIRMIGCSNDISDRKQAEAKLQATNEQLRQSIAELARANQLKDDFLSRISHELRTPLSSIKMATKMLNIRLQPLGLLEDESNSIQRYLTIIKTQCEREIELITNLLDLTRSETLIESVDLAPLELQHFLPHVVAPFYEQTQFQQQDLSLSIPSNLPTLTTDRTYLERILQELLQNACKYTPAGEQIALSVRSLPLGIEISVSNSGIDIPQTEQERIFDRFYRLSNSDPWQHGGTGLGLALVKQLVQQIGGQITLESSNLNTRFILTLPWRNVSTASPED